MSAPSITSFSPHIFSSSNKTLITITGSNWNQPGKTSWLQIRDTALASTPLGIDKSFIASSTSTGATVEIPAGKIDYLATNYKLFYGVSNSPSELPTGTGAWHSSTKIPFVYIFDVNIAGGNVPVQGGLKSTVLLFNVPEQAFATVTLTPQTVCSKSWSGAGDPAPISVDASLQILDEQTREGIIPFVTPLLPWEGQYRIDVSLTLPADPDEGEDSDDDPTPSTDPGDTSPNAAVPGQGLIGYMPILGTLTDMTVPSVPTMAISCKFSSTNPAPDSKLNQHIPDNTELASWPDWLDDFDIDPTKPGAGDIFDYTGDDDNDGNYKLFIIDGTGHYVLDEPNFSMQLMHLNGSGQFINGTPVAVRVFVQGKGWRCARMQVDNLTYGTTGHHPTRWVIDNQSKEYPSKPEELFGIYQLVNDPVYKPGHEHDDDNLRARASPCIIETIAPNMINIGIDKVIIVPGAYRYPIDPYFVASSIARVYLLPAASPPQSFVWGDGGFSDGFSVDASIYSVYFKGYITYVAPTDDMAATTPGPSLNPSEAISATCIGSSPLVNQNYPNTKYLLMVASEPSVLIRPANLFYTISKDGQAPSVWKPLMSNMLAYTTSNGSGQASVVQIPNSTTILLFQRKKPEIVNVFVCTVNFTNNTLVLKDGNSVLTLKSETVMDSVIAAFKARFGITDLTDVGLVNDSWFSVMYQATAGSLGSAGYHIFTSPQGLTSSVVHLWYPATSTAPFIDETNGTCLGVYGSMKKYFPSPEPPTPSAAAATSQPLLQIVTGNLGSKVDLYIDSVTYGGVDPVYIEVKAIKSGNNLTYGIREWSSFGNGDFQTSSDYVISNRPQNLTLKTATQDCQLTLHWEKSAFGNTPVTIDASQVFDGDIWIFEVLPFSVTNVTSGVPNNGDGIVVVDTSGSKLPFNAKFSCEFSLVYTAPPDESSYGYVTVINSKNTGPNASQDPSDLIIPNMATVLDENYTATLSPSVANVKVTVGGTPATQDQWFIKISKGIVYTPVSGTENNGDWAYPAVSGSYSGSKIKVWVSCTSSTKEKAEFIYTVTPIDETDQPGEPTVSNEPFSLKPITKKNSANVDLLVGWTTTTFSNGLVFGFDNITGLPANRDMWTFTVLASTPVVEVMGQRPVAAFTKAGSTDAAWIVVPTKAAGGRFLQLQIPIINTQDRPNLPTRAALLPLRSTLEPYLSTGSDGPILYFKGLKVPGLSWSGGIEKEVSTDAINQKIYGLASFLGVDYRPAHSGLIYSVRVTDIGISDVNIDDVTTFSTLAADDLITEPKMADKYLQQLPPAGWTTDPLSTSPPAYIPTGWFAIFPQYRFHIGQVHVISDFATLFGFNVASVSSVLQSPVMGAAGRQVFDETFFINTMVSVNHPDIFQQFQAAVMTEMRDISIKGWLKDSDGNPVNPFNNSDFYNSVVYDPAWATDSDYPKVAKYILQLALLRAVWNEPPFWSMPTSEGRTVPAYWRFRIGGPTCDQYMNEAFQSACYLNKYNKLKNSLLSTYFSTDPIFVEKFGSAAAASAYVLTDVRLETSFAQMPSRSRAKLVEALTQSVGSDGVYLLRIVVSYLAGRAIMNNFTPIPGNQTSDVPVSVKSSDKSKPPAQWEILIHKFCGPLMYGGLMGQGIVNLLTLLMGEDINLADLIKGIEVALKDQRGPGTTGDRPKLESRSSSTNIDQSIGEITEQSAAIRSAELSLPDTLKKELAKLKAAAKFKYAKAVTSLIIGFALIAGTADSWKTNTEEGGMGVALNIVSVVLDVVAFAQFGVNVADCIISSKTTKRLEALSAEMAEQVKDLAKSLKRLERLNKALGGLLNVVFGIENLLSGFQELSKGGSQKVDGRYDIASGSLMLVGGIMELAGAVGAAAPVPVIGELIAGIGMELSIVKLWVKGPEAVGAYGEILLDVFDIDGGMTEEDLIVNLIRHVKACAVQAKVSRQVTTVPLVSPDPRDGGIEVKGSPYIIEPFYSTEDIGDQI